MSAPKTRHQAGTKLAEFVGPGKDLNPGEVPTLRAALQKGILIRERLLIEQDVAKKDIHARDICKELAPAVLAQWQKANPKFIPPVVVKEACLVVKLEKVWNKAKDVALGRGKQADRERVGGMLDKLLEVTNITIETAQL